MGGVAYYITPPASLTSVFTDPFHAVFYVSFILMSCAVFSKAWMEVSGSSSQVGSQQCAGDGVGGLGGAGGAGCDGDCVGGGGGAGCDGVGGGGCGGGGCVDDDVVLVVLVLVLIAGMVVVAAAVVAAVVAMVVLVVVIMLAVVVGCFACRVGFCHEVGRKSLCTVLSDNQTFRR